MKQFFCAAEQGKQERAHGIKSELWLKKGILGIVQIFSDRGSTTLQGNKTDNTKSNRTPAKLINYPICLRLQTVKILYDVEHLLTIDVEVSVSLGSHKSDVRIRFHHIFANM